MKVYCGIMSWDLFTYYGQWVEEQKYLRVKCACGTTDIKVTESLYNEVAKPLR